MAGRRSESTGLFSECQLCNVQTVILSTLDERGIIQILPGAGSSLTEFEGRIAFIFLCVLRQVMLEEQRVDIRG
jgi:hypothetical protein